MVSFSLILPVYQGASFLEASLERTATWLGGFGAQAGLDCELIVVDDGSGDKTASVARVFAETPRGVEIHVLADGVHRGKGGTVRRGMLAARGRHRVFLDADLAYPPENVAAILAALQAGADVACASRMHPKSAYRFDRGFWARHLLGRSFNAAVRLLAVPGLADTQAGLKGFTAEAADRLFRQGRLTGFGFDVELLFLARRAGLRIAEVPVSCRYEKGASTLHPMRDGFRMLFDLLRIRWWSMRGAYGSRAVAPPPVRAGEPLR